MAKEIRLNAFEMNTVGHQAPGLWRHPRDRSADYRTLSYWTGLAQTLERGRFDGLFIADVLGIYDVFGGSPDAALRTASQVPVDDPLLLVSAMAAVTRNLGFGITVNLSYEPPYPFARRMTTLDHLTEGRIGWNIVTGYLDSAAKAMGLDRQRGHDDRYDVAEDYLELVYKLWEGSWDDDAVVADRAAGIFTRPEKVHRIRHDGPFYQLDAIHLSEPSLQRTPVLYQAGTSPKGRGFAGRHAECVFVSGPSTQVIGPRVADLRRAAVAAGRQGSDLKVFSMATVVLAETDRAAQAKLDDYRSYVSHEGALTLMSGWTGVDFSQLALDQEVRHVENDAGRTAMDNITRADPNRIWTVREVAEHVAIGGIGPVFVGSPATVADALIQWVDATDVDGFNMAYAVAPETFEDIVEFLVPELERRGRYKRAYAPGPLREKLFGPGRARLAPPHPAARWRGRALADAAE
ncbi:LLM class flavin-dependent oxidoreductase [Chelatococcus reniformis]|uniref:Monooxygenase n=1 Tax=Chelatococcus reniformis TaxID=1494448 RepID=A0A916XNK1_9HYPH|nr:LLM class flavin-dependent oxidoreductase [Chelatococcus reniformis]GGC89677.1 monooxygenase [Chelatococcus reniformis]